MSDWLSGVITGALNASGGTSLHPVTGPSAVIVKPKPNPSGTINSTLSTNPGAHNSPGVLAPVPLPPHLARPAKPHRATAGGSHHRAPHATHTSVKPSGRVTAPSAGIRIAPAGSTHGGATPAGAGVKPKPAGPALQVPPDAITQLIAGSLQQNQRATDAYNTATQAQIAGTPAAMPYTQLAGSQAADPATAALENTYAGYLNRTGQAGTNVQNAGQSNWQGLLQSSIADANQRNIQYGQQLRANEPALRQQQQAADAKQALDVAQQQYLQDQLSLKGQQAVDSSKLNWAKLGTQQDQFASKQQQQASQFQLSNQLKLALAGQKLATADKKGINDWINHNIISHDPSGNILTAHPHFADIFDSLSASVTDPISAAKVAISYADKGSLKDPNDFYGAIKGSMSKRQAVRLVQQVYGAKTANAIKRTGYAANLGGFAAPLNGPVNTALGA